MFSILNSFGFNPLISSRSHNINPRRLDGRYKIDEVTGLAYGLGGLDVGERNVETKFI